MEVVRIEGTVGEYDFFVVSIWPVLEMFLIVCCGFDVKFYSLWAVVKVMMDID